METLCSKRSPPTNSALMSCWSHESIGNAHLKVRGDASSNPMQEVESPDRPVIASQADSWFKNSTRGLRQLDSLERRKNGEQRWGQFDFFREGMAGHEEVRPDTSEPDKFDWFRTIDDTGRYQRKDVCFSVKF